VEMADSAASYYVAFWSVCSNPQAQIRTV
jgi:hypothetical protein